ncbi:MAG TPA: hypothetical protein VKE91_14400, partial [Blastocatellia bacterium]|nr:hypothetical protein [Blastocatellia bacterium]
LNSRNFRLGRSEDGSDNRPANVVHYRSLISSGARRFNRWPFVTVAARRRQIGEIGRGATAFRLFVRRTGLYGGRGDVCRRRRAHAAANRPCAQPLAARARR